MRIGVSLQSAYNVDDPRLGARWMIEQARAARDARLDSLFVGDHHSTGPGAYYQNTPIMGRLLAEWYGRPAGVLLLVPLWNPVLAAEQVGTLAAVAEGRFVVQTGLGVGEAQFAGIGSRLRGRVHRLEVGLDVMRRLLAGETVTDDTGTFPIRGARIAPVPSETVEVWIGAGVPAAIDRAARIGDAWICNANVVPHEAQAQATRYVDGCRALGATPSAVAIRRDVYVGTDHTSAAARAQLAIDAGYRGFGLDALLYGDVASTIERVREYGRLGFTDIIVRPFGDQRDALATLERLGDVRAAVEGD
jgi:alkanesulfonate monooxygenase SsuD/methylene tetrahydromethanopterin reductase-like flavin-dependent oxidoreductase (luciferase family)